MMTLKLKRTLLAASLLAMGVLPVAADAPGSLGKSHGIYLGEGKVLDVEFTRQLTLHEDVLGYQFSPSGEKIAYVSYQDDHGERSLAVKVVDTWRSDPEPKTLFKQTVKEEPDNPWDALSLTLIGWGGDDRFLLFCTSSLGQGDGSAPADALALAPKIEMLDLNAPSPDPQMVPFDSTSASDAVLMMEYAWAPSHNQLLLSRTSFPGSDAATPRNPDNFLFDPASRQLKPLAIDPLDTVLGWLENGNLLLLHKVKGKRGTYREYDLATGAATDSAQPPQWDRRLDLQLDIMHYSHEVDDPKDASLQLDVAQHQLPASEGGDVAPASTVWVRHNPVVKKLGLLPVGVVPGSDSPQAQWSPTGKAVAFAAHGDLFLTSLIKRRASPQEKLAAGEQLDCAEETQIASSDLKQIGLGLLQYIQDNDERYPPTSNFHDAVYPYIKSESVFSLGDSKFNYHGPDMKSLASIDDPASLVLGEMNTPCARIVLYADGHVKAINQ